MEFIGGIFTNSVAIISDSVHDLGDAISIGISYFMERKSKKKADNKYTYGYIRYSVLGGVITTTILIVGSILVIIGAIKRLFNPVAAKALASIPKLKDCEAHATYIVTGVDKKTLKELKINITCESEFIQD